MDPKEAGFYNAVLIVSGILGVIITYFIISIIRQQRRSVQLYRQSILTEITTLEKERSRIASDLHDEVGPVLTAVKYKVASFDLTDEDDKAESEKTLKQIDEIIQRMREVSFNLMPTVLVRQGFAAALHQFIEYCNKGNASLKINFQSEEAVPLTEQQSINLYRIGQEIIHNAIKHSGATELRLELRKQKGLIVFASSDNGVGFNYDSRYAESTGYGLRNLLSRAELMEGKMFVESKKDKGTTYIFEIPISND
jgi:signal transduction histidine kinase